MIGTEALGVSYSISTTSFASKALVGVTGYQSSTSLVSIGWIVV